MSRLSASIIRAFPPEAMSGRVRSFWTRLDDGLPCFKEGVPS